VGIPVPAPNLDLGDLSRNHTDNTFLGMLYHRKIRRVPMN
jgi:hypothetical protein